MLLGQVCITKIGKLESEKGQIIINFRIFLNKSVFVSNIHVLKNFSSLLSVPTLKNKETLMAGYFIPFFYIQLKNQFKNALLYCK